jgi:hypothetical protein
MRFPPRNKVPASREREERLRKGRMAAQALRDVFPSATLVTVNLNFVPTEAPPHAAQSFSLYPAARAFFSYPCPYGDCDGIYDLSTEADRAVANGKSRVTGVLTCDGMRARDGRQGQPCGLRVNYSIGAEHEVARPAVRTGAK